MLSGALDRGAIAMYPDAIEARVCLEKDVTIEHIDTIVDYRSWHQFATIELHEDVKELVFPQFSES